MKVIIVGAGIGGLSAAIALHQAGCEVSLYERAPKLMEVGAGISVWSNAFYALDQIGVGEDIRSASLAVARTEIRVNCGNRIAGAFDAKAVEKNLNTIPLVGLIHRAELVERLANYLPQQSIRYAAECVDVSQSGGQVSVHFRDGSSDSADVHVGADGIRSIVRCKMFGEEPVRYSGYTCFRGICARPALIEPGYLAEWWGMGKRVGITTLLNDRVYWWATLNAPANWKADDAASELRRQFSGWADPLPEIFDSTLESAVIQNDIIDRPPTKRGAKAASC